MRIFPGRGAHDPDATPASVYAPSAQQVAERLVSRRHREHWPAKIVSTLTGAH